MSNTKSTPRVPGSLGRQLRGAQIVTVLTGAGVSAESGVPTFRDAQTGLWAKYDPQELATRTAFRRDPQLVWEWYRWRKELIRVAAPNAAHEALVSMEERVPRFHLITQNIDGLHERAGSSNVVELHGNIYRARCFVEDTVTDSWDDAGSGGGLPRCTSCGGLLRPDVVWFGEALPGATLQQAAEAAQQADVFLSVGTSALVYPAAGLPAEAARHGAIVVEVNPTSTPLSALADYVLRGPAGQLLPTLVAAAWPETDDA